MAHKKRLKKRYRKEHPPKKKARRQISEKKEKGEYSNEILDYIDKLSDYIQWMLLRGYKEEYIKQELLSVGWPIEIIEEELSKIKNKRDKDLSNQKTNNFIGRLLFIFMLVVVIIIYGLLVFNQVSIKHSGYWVLYVIFGALLFILIILIRPLLLSTKRVQGKGGKEEKPSIFLGIFKSKPQEQIRGEKIRILLEKKRIKAEKLRLKEEKRERLLEKKRKKEEEKKEKWLERKRKEVERLMLKEERKKEKKPGIFLKVFKRKPKVEEQRKELKPEKEKMPTVKREEGKVVEKKVRTERKKLKIFYFILFLLSIATGVIAYLYSDMMLGLIAVILMFIFLWGYKKIKKPEEKVKKEKIPLVKELPRSSKIELERYETDLDALYKLVEEKGRVKLSALAKYFGVDRKNVEEWATILEGHNLIKIHYPAFGEPEVRIVNR